MPCIKRHPKWVAGLVALALGLALYGIDPAKSNLLLGAVVDALTSVMTGDDSQ